MTRQKGVAMGGPRPVGVDTTQASVARVYNHSLGGKDNYDVDRTAYRQILEVSPRHGEVSVMRRRWLHRVLRYLAGRAGVTQFLDIGAGLPTIANTHQVVQMENPWARVVYVDNDPVCNAHGRALLEQNEDTRFVLGDFLHEGTLLEHKEIRGFLDLDLPVGVVVSGLLAHIADDLDPAGVMRAYVDRLPRGSYLAISHFWDPVGEDADGHDMARALEKAYVAGGLGSGWFRTRGQILEYFGGLELVPPGLVELPAWWPAGPSPRELFPEEHLMLGGVAYKADPGHEPVPIRAAG